MKVRIEGNIGSGKSSVIAGLKTRLSATQFHVLPEPTHLWDNELKLFYADGERWGFLLNCKAMTTLRQAYDSHEHVIQERSVDSSMKVFANACRDFTKKEEYDLFKVLHEEFAKNVIYDLTIYLRTPPQVCLDRVKKRNGHDKCVSLDYLEKLHEEHDKWLINAVCINGDQPLDEVIELVEKQIIYSSSVPTEDTSSSCCASPEAVMAGASPEAVMVSG